MIGRIVLPVELRVTMDLQVNGSLEFYVEDSKDVAAFRGRNVCENRIRELKG